VAYSIGRWTDPTFRATDQAVLVENSYVVAPRYSGKREFKHSGPEIALIEEYLRGEEIDPASIDTLDETLKTRPAPLLHFICHGSAGGGYAASLFLIGEQGEEELTSEMFRGLPGVRQSFEKKEPMVFLNACEAGRQVPGLIGSGGFAQACLRRGARAAIAPLWRVKDELAAKVAVEVYKTVLADPDRALADVLRDVRKQTYRQAEAEDSYAAYCFYGDPHTRIRV
jgi:CHAT domain-containing protein